MNASRKEHIARAIYDKWRSRHPGESYTWDDLLAKAPMLLNGWMEFAEVAIQTIPWETDLLALFDEANLDELHDHDNACFNAGLEKGLEIVRAWRDAMLRGE